MLRFLVTALLWGAVCYAEDSTLSEAAANSSERSATMSDRVAAPTTGQKTLHEFGQTFVLVSHRGSELLDTEEYLPEAENPDNWSQSIVYQRLTFAAPAAPDAFVANMKKQIEDSAPGSQLRLVQQGPNASIFAVHYAKSAQQEEQVAIALAAVADPKRPNELHLIQLALRPGRLDLATMESLVKRWQARFQSQAASLNR